MMKDTKTALYDERVDVVRIDCFSNDYKQQIIDFLPERFSIVSLEYEIDFLYDRKELSSFLGFDPKNRNCSCDQLLSACFYLKQLDRFKKIELSIKKENDGFSLVFHLNGHFLFSKLSISGLVRDKDFYKNMYLIDIADIFDYSKHQHSITLMQQYFYDRGYCNARVVDTIQENNEEKKVSVKLALVKGSRFTIDKVKFDVQSVGTIAQVDVLRMKKMIEDVCLKRLQAKTYSQELLQKMEEKIKFLLDRYGFLNFDLKIIPKIRSSEHKVSLRFLIALEQKKEFIFVGNRFFKRQEILDRLLLYGKSSWHFPSSVIIDELIQLYKSKGFWKVKVSIREEKNRVFCLINEGKRISLKSVVFKDNDHFSDQELFKEAFKKCLCKKYFDKESYEKALERLIAFYKRHGFWDIQVVDEQFVLLDHETFSGKETEKKKNILEKYQLILMLDEGKRRKLGSCTIVGYADLEEQGLFAELKKIRGLDFDYILILEQKQWLLRHFRNLGYGKVGLEYKLKEKDGYLDVIWTISLQNQVTKFGKVLVKGNSCLPVASIIKEVTIKTGEAWDRAKLEETGKRLRDLKIFDSVQVYPSHDLDNDFQRPIFVKVIDADRYELRTRMGVQQVGKDFRLRRGTTYKIGGSFLVRNPLQIADLFVFEGDFTRYYRNAAVSYQYPWLFSQPIRCQYKLYDTVYEQPVYIGSKSVLYQAGQLGFLFNATRTYDSMTVGGNVGIEFMGIKEADQPDLQKIIDYDKRLIDKKIGYVFIEPNVVWQKVDSLFNPKKGHLSFVSCKAMIDTNARTSFFKLLIEHSLYVPFIERLVLAIRMRGGHVFNRRYNQLIPIERFYLGGANTIRGYERDYCPPLGLLTIPVKDEYNQLPPDAGNLWRYAPQGGRTMVNINIELRLALIKEFGMVIFNDIGALFKDSITHSTDNFFGGSGFGLRYTTPIGPLRFDFGCKWHRRYKNFETWCVWYLTLGQAF
ncbi:BamA/TamA family outer membrane protein [Candidatus Dependentiae bacterium]|nr:BamA/TamA family outer membrane protein [Candidatus Dependentiae bacterium]